MDTITKSRCCRGMEEKADLENMQPKQVETVKAVLSGKNENAQQNLKAEAADGSSSPASVSSTPARGRRGRKRAMTENQNLNAEEEKNVEIPMGSGSKLGDIFYINSEITKRRINDEVISDLHRVLFGVVGMPRSRKGNLREFCGYPQDFSETDSVVSHIDALSDASLARVISLLHLPQSTASAERHELVEELYKFILSPKEDTSVQPSTPAKRGRKPASSSPKNTSPDIISDEEISESSEFSEYENDSDDYVQPKSATPKVAKTPLPPGSTPRRRGRPPKNASKIPANVVTPVVAINESPSAVHVATPPSVPAELLDTTKFQETVEKVMANVPVDSVVEPSLVENAAEAKNDSGVSPISALEAVAVAEAFAEDVKDFATSAVAPSTEEIASKTEEMQ